MPAEGGAWKRGWIHQQAMPLMDQFKRIVVGVDPAGTANRPESETGIVVCGLHKNGHAYVLDDASLNGSPDEWARAAVAAVERWSANYIVAEVNFGGDMVAHTIRTVNPNLMVKQVRASRGKLLRAEPIMARYEQGHVAHVRVFAELERQMISWIPGSESPDRMDALVWALTDVLGVTDISGRMAIGRHNLWGRSNGRKVGPCMTQASASQSRLVNGIRRVREFIVSELIGRSVRPQPQVKTQPTTDAKRPDYVWYDKLRLGLQPGYELATPFCRPIISNIVAWTLGDLFTITAEEEQLQRDANKFVQDHKSLIIGWMQDALALGDGYLFLNPLGSLTRLTPDVVEIGTDPSDADRIVKMTITTVSVDDETTTDVWTLEGREITISGGERTAPEVQTYSNPLGLIPVVHLAWNRQANEIYGRPVYEQLVTVFSRYHDLLHSTLRGVEIMGMPMPVISGVENLSALSKRTRPAIRPSEPRTAVQSRARKSTGNSSEARCSGWKARPTSTSALPLRSQVTAAPCSSCCSFSSSRASTSRSSSSAPPSPPARPRQRRRCPPSPA